MKEIVEVVTAALLAAGYSVGTPLFYPDGTAEMEVTTRDGDVVGVSFDA